MAVSANPHVALVARADKAFLVPGVLLFSLVLLRVPLLFPSRLSFAVSLLPFCGAILALLDRKSRWFMSPWALLVMGYVLLALVAAVRGSHNGAITANSALQQGAQIGLVAVLGLLAFLREPEAQRRASYLRALCWAPVAFLAVNVVLWTAGYVPIGGPLESSPSTMLGAFGVSINRVTFPIAGGVNIPLAAVALSICLVFISRAEQRKLAICGALLSFFVILAIDSRGALIFGASGAALALAFPRARQRRHGLVGLALPVLPLIAVLALTNVANLPIATQLGREGATGSVASGTGRTAVWDAAASSLTEPRVDNIFGYGLLGQKTSGVSVEYAYLFAGEEDPLSHTVHNGVLQVAFDTGWVGAIGLVLLAAIMLGRLGRRAVTSTSYAALLAGSLALLLAGIVEAVPSPEIIDSFAWWLLVTLAAIRALGPQERGRSQGVQKVPDASS